MASITITTTPAQDARLAPAFGDLLNVPGGTASAAQIKTWLIDQLRAAVFTYETQQAVSSLPPPSTFAPS